MICFSCQLQSVLDLNSNTFILSCDSTTAVKTVKKTKKQTRVKFVPAQLNKTSTFLSFQTTKPVVSTQSSTGGYIQRSKRLRTPLNMSAEHLLPSGLTFPWDTHTHKYFTQLLVSQLPELLLKAGDGWLLSFHSVLSLFFIPSLIPSSFSAAASPRRSLFYSLLPSATPDASHQYTEWLFIDEMRWKSTASGCMDWTHLEENTHGKTPRCFIVIQDMEEISLGDPVWPCMSLWSSEDIWGGLTRYPDLVVVENSENLHGLGLAVKLQQARNGLWGSCGRHEYDKYHGIIQKKNIKKNYFQH